ncbi:MAG: hypothetical protein E7467_00380 [Ruminococcaceae bacterium]|nr:hypothetical protein [Oscillospiraceae bacterium]
MSDIGVQGDDRIRQPVCIHTMQITDCCLDKDCIEDLRVYLTEQSQAAVQSASSTKIRSAELLFTTVSLEPLAYKKGYYAVDLTFYYRIVGEALQGAMRPSAIVGLCIFAKRAVLYGGKSKAKVFHSTQEYPTSEELLCGDLPEAVVEALDPMVLSSCVREICECRCCESQVPEIPQFIENAFGETLVTGCQTRQLYVSIGQFSTVRLERDTQLSVHAEEYCAPTRECCDDEGCEEDPCELFSRIDFPMQAFFPESNGNCC